MAHDTPVHPAIKEDQKLIASLEARATQFLLEAGIQIEGDQYCADLAALENEYEFVKALMFVKHMYPNEDFPEGMSEEDVDKNYLDRYPFIAAVGIIELAKQFKTLSDRIATLPAVSIEQCHNYAFNYWRIKWLADILTMSEVYKDNFRRRQQEVAHKPRRDALQRLIVDILTDYPHYTANEVRSELEKHAGEGVIETITDDEIEWAADDGKAKNTPISGLKDRVSRAKQNPKSR